MYRFMRHSCRRLLDLGSQLITSIDLRIPRRLVLTRCLPPEPFVTASMDIADLMKHKFTVLGRTLAFDAEIEWDADFKGGKWPILGQKDYSPFFDDDYSLPMYKEHGDVKRVWDFNKHIHFVDLAAQYCRTRNEAIDAEVCSQLRDWIEKHPYARGMGWYPPLIVAQRAISWIIAWNLGCFSTLHDMLAKSLFLHGYDLRRRLEISNDGVNSNHLIGNLAALHLIGCTLNLEKWRDYALDLLLAEIEKQVLPDGVDYEQSSSYHRYVLEFLSLVWLADNRGPSRLTEKIRSMITFLNHITLPDHTLPLLSDQDGARVWVRDIYRPAELLSLVPTPAATSRAFPDSGYYVMRYDNHVLVFDCGSIGMQGKRLSTHGHSDLLSFTLSLFGKPFIIDIGSGTYTESKEIHDYFRSTRGHNTLSVDGLDQCGLSRTWTFLRHPSYRVLEWRSSAVEDSVCGEHDGFSPVIHRRRIALSKGYEPEMRITDQILGSGTHDVVSRFHLHPSVRVESVDERKVALGFENVGLEIQVLGESRLPALTVGRGMYSPDYGQIEETNVIELDLKGECPLTIELALRGALSLGRE